MIQTLDKDRKFDLPSFCVGSSGPGIFREAFSLSRASGSHGLESALSLKTIIILLLIGSGYLNLKLVLAIGKNLGSVPTEIQSHMTKTQCISVGTSNWACTHAEVQSGPATRQPQCILPNLKRKLAQVCCNYENQFFADRQLGKGNICSTSLVMFQSEILA
jgi:hypothetical protein